MQRWFFLVLLCACSCAALAWGGEDAGEPEAPGLASSGPPLVARPGTAERIEVVVLHGETDELNFYSLKRRLEDAATRKADLVVIDLDSPGGPVFTSNDIARLIGEYRAAPIVIYVSNQALSGGAMAALGSPVIVMDHNTTIGATQPIILTPSGPLPFQAAPEKALSVVRAIIRALAQNNGYPEALCEAMVDPDIELHRVVMKDGTVKYMKGPEFDQFKDSPEGIGMAEQRIISPKGNLLTLTEKEALEYGIAKRIVGSRAEVLSYYGAAGAVTKVLNRSTGEQLLAFLNSIVVSVVLILVGIVAVYFALTTPGFGVPEVLAIACFALFFFSKIMVGKADMLEVAMFILGCGLLAVEIFVIPGFGVVGILGILMIIVSLILSLQSFTIPQNSFELSLSLMNVIQVFVTMGVATVGIFCLLRLSPNIPGLNRLVLKAETSSAAGFVVETREQRGLVGAHGVATTWLRPAGRAEIGGKALQVVTQGDYIETGEPIQVCRVDGNRVIVKKA